LFRGRIKVMSLSTIASHSPLIEYTGNR